MRQSGSPRGSLGKTNGRASNHFCSVSEAADGEPGSFAHRADPHVQPVVATDVQRAAQIVTGFDQFAAER